MGLNLGLPKLTLLKQERAFKPQLKTVGSGRHERLAFSYALSKVMRFDEALHELYSVVQDYPNALYPRIAIANILVLRQQYTQAIRYCHEIMRIDPLMVQGPLRAAGGYTAIGDFEQAEKHLQMAVDLDPNMSSIWLAAGQLNLFQQQDEAAIECFYQALKLDPESLLTYIMLSEVYTKQLKFEDAVAYLRHAIKLKPRFLLGHTRLGQAYIKQRKFTLAKQSFQTALSLDAKAIEPRVGLAQFWIGTGRLVLAEKEFEIIQSITQRSADDATADGPTQAELQPIRALDETCNLNLLIYSAALADQEKYLLE